MEERPVYSYIPKNLNATGGLFGGAVDTRRLIEAIVGALIAVLIYRFLNMFFKGDIVFYISATIGVALFAAGMAGGNGEPLSVFLLNFINYERRRIFVTLRPPMPEFDAKKKKKKDDDNDGSFEDRMLRRIRSIRSIKEQEDKS